MRTCQQQQQQQQQLTAAARNQAPQADSNHAIADAI